MKERPSPTGRHYDDIRIFGTRSGSSLFVRSAGLPYEANQTGFRPSLRHAVAQENPVQTGRLGRLDSDLGTQATHGRWTMNSISELRRRLYENGYRTVAIKNGLKFPTDIAWTDRARRDPPAVISERFDLGWSGTGILCDGLRPIDIDLSNPDHIEQVMFWCLDNLGRAPIRYRDDAPRMLLVYRAEDGEPHKSKQWNGDLKIGVEVLGHGNQFFAYGVHPSGCKLQWMDGVGPHTMPRDQLTAISEHQVGQLLDFVKPFVGEAAKKNHQLEPLQFHSGISQVTDEQVRQVLDAIPNFATDYDWWLRIGMAVFSSTGGSGDGYEMWRSWSAQNGEHSDRETNKVWRALLRTPPSRVGFGTLVFHAREADPTFCPANAVEKITPLERLRASLKWRYSK